MHTARARRRCTHGPFVVGQSAAASGQFGRRGDLDVEQVRGPGGGIFDAQGVVDFEHAEGPGFVQLQGLFSADAWREGLAAGGEKDHKGDRGGETARGGRATAG